MYYDIFVHTDLSNSNFNSLVYKHKPTNIVKSSLMIQDIERNKTTKIEIVTAFI